MRVARTGSKERDVLAYVATMPPSEVAAMRQRRAVLGAAQTSAMRGSMLAGETLVDRLPAGAGVEIDEERHRRSSTRAARYCREVALEVLEAADQLGVVEPAELRHLTAERLRLGADPLTDGVADLRRQRRLERGARLRQRLDLRARPLQRGAASGQSPRVACESPPARRADPEPVAAPRRPSTWRQRPHRMNAEESEYDLPRS